MSEGLSIPAGDSTKRDGWFAVRGGGTMVGVVVFVALLVRMAHLFVVVDLPTSRALVGDARGYYEWALAIASGGSSGGAAGYEAPFYQAPLYPYVLAGMMMAGARSVGALIGVQMLWGVCSACVVALLTRRWFGVRAGWVGGIMVALYAPGVFFDGIIQKASLAWLLVCLLLECVSRAGASKRLAWRVAAGMALGMLILTRENAMVWVPVLLVWAAWRRRGESMRRRLLACGLFVAGLAVVLVPVGVRNVLAGGTFSVSTFQAGPNFFIGNSRDATGRYVPLVRGHETPEFERKDATDMAVRAVGRPLSPPEVSRYWMARAWADVLDAPGRWLALMALKLGLVLNAYEIGDVESLYVVRTVSPVLSWLSYVWHFGTLFPLAVAGMWLTRARLRTLWVAYALLGSMILAVALFYVMARYRLPLVPLLVPFAAIGAVGLFDFFRRVIGGRVATREDVRLNRASAESGGRSAWRWGERGDGRQNMGSGAAWVREHVLAAVFALVAFVACNVPLVDEARLDALSFMNYGVAYAREGSLGDAEAMFERSVEAFPDSPEARVNLGQVLALTGRYAESIPHYEAALAVAPELPGTYYNLGVAYERIGEPALAWAAFEHAVEQDPGDAEAYAAFLRLSDSK